MTIFTSTLIETTTKHYHQQKPGRLYTLWQWLVKISALDSDQYVAGSSRTLKMSKKIF